ncbi:MAG: hypothetical protein AMK73_09875 [Planctomycetes bacterium SM23_32]|nr:MAG: hypothetical protein AMK73_09875 [Planctomycetes bacterium SM23_32]
MADERRKPPDLSVRAPAKVNLCLEVLGRRPDGFHEIRTVMQAVSLFDEMDFRLMPEGRVELSCPEGDVPTGEGNLIVRAARLLQRRYAVEQGAAVTLRKRIPVGGGLGGGSADAAMALLALRELWGVEAPPGELGGLAAELGSDVPFFLHGGAALCEGRGERVTPLPVRGPMHFVLVMPGVRVSTAAVYSAAGRRLTGQGPASDNVVEALREGDVELLGSCLRNDLQEAAFSLCTDLRAIWDLLVEAGRQIGARGCLLSGSGSSFLVLVAGAPAAEEAAGELASRLGVDCAAVQSVSEWAGRVVPPTTGRGHR